MELDDKKLIEKYLSGDDAAFEQLTRKYLKNVYNFLFRITSDRAVLDDLTQETFIKVWKNMRRYDKEKSFKAWLFTIAKNTAFDYLKKKKTLPFANFTSDEGYSYFDEIPEDKILPDELLEQKDAAKQLEEKLEKIPEQYRIILTMRYMDDLTLHEIADILALPYNTIKSQHARALRNLRDAFDKNEDLCV